MTLEELRTARTEGVQDLDAFEQEVWKLAEERLLLEQLASGESQVLLIPLRQPQGGWEIDVGLPVGQCNVVAPTLSAAIRKAKGVSDAH